MRLLFMHPSKQFADGAEYGYALTPATARNRLPSSARMWGADLARTLAERGHRVTYAALETPAFMAARFDAATVTIAGGAGLKFLCASDFDAVRAHCAEADGFVLRHDYPCYAALFDGLALLERPVVQILCAHNAVRYCPTQRRAVLLVNSTAEVARYRQAGLNTHLFVKPARAIFYVSAPPALKRYDILSVMWDSRVPRKRFDLLLDALPMLDARTSRPLCVALVGDTAAHAARITALQATLARISIIGLGALRPEALVHVYREARLTVVASREDASPQVMTESLACDTPVACAADITGGGHQITAATGALFAPTPADLAQTVLSMLDHLQRFAPARHTPTLADSANQLESVLADG